LKKHRSMCSAPLVSRQFCLEDMLSHDTDALVPCDAASHLVRVEKIWDVPIRPTVAEDNQVVRRAMTLRPKMLLGLYVRTDAT